MAVDIILFFLAVILTFFAAISAYYLIGGIFARLSGHRRTDRDYTLKEVLSGQVSSKDGYNRDPGVVCGMAVRGEGENLEWLAQGNISDEALERR